MPLFNRFRMPDNGACALGPSPPPSQPITLPPPPPGNSLFWYSHDYGSAHLVMMSSEHDCGEGSPQYAWFEQDLKR